MKRFLAAAVAALVLIAAPLAATAADPRTMTFPKLDFRIPSVERFVLDNGMIVYLLEDHELPLVNATAYIRTGAIYEPADKTGLAGISGAVMRSGGIEGIAPEKLDAELEDMASSVESSIGADVGNVSLSTLRRNFDRTLELFAGVLMRPAYDQRRFDLAVKKTLEALRRQNDDPKALGDRELEKSLYPNHPLGRYPTPGSVKAITRGDAAAFHDAWYAPNNIILAVSGDITRKELQEKLTRVFGGWKKKDVALRRVGEPDAAMHPGVLLIRKEIEQSVIRMGHLGITKDNPDLHAIRVMDFILGGNGFNSRLMTEVREKRGLAYNVESAFDVGRIFPGTFEAETETKSGSTVKTSKLILDLIAGMTARPVTDDELSLAKESMVNSFIFAFAKSDYVVNQKARLEYYRYPEGYLENYRDNIARVTKEDILRVAKKYLHPEALTIVVVGNEKKFDAPLSELGKVSVITPENGR